MSLRDTDLRYGTFRRPWLPCEMHGVPFRDCWGCNKPTGLCGYGYCGRAATHNGAGRFCCEPHAAVLADINGNGAVTALAADVLAHLSERLAEAGIEVTR